MKKRSEQGKRQGKTMKNDPEHMKKSLKRDILRDPKHQSYARLALLSHEQHRTGVSSGHHPASEQAIRDVLTL